MQRRPHAYIFSSKGPFAALSVVMSSGAPTATRCNAATKGAKRDVMPIRWPGGDSSCGAFRLQLRIRATGNPSRDGRQSCRVRSHLKFLEVYEAV